MVQKEEQGGNWSRSSRPSQFQSYMVPVLPEIDRPYKTELLLLGFEIQKFVEAKKYM